MNVLGQRTGVGKLAWSDIDDQSALLRLNAIRLACNDVKVSLMSCCGMSVLYGLAVVTIGVATGIEAAPEMAGGKLDPALFKKSITESKEIANFKYLLSNDKVFSSFLTAPPPSLLIDQKLVERVSVTSDGERVKRSLSEQERFGICCSVNETDGLVLYGAEIKVEIESPSSVPTRKSFDLVPFVHAEEFDDSANPDSTWTNNGDTVGEEPPPSKRTKTENSNGDSNNLDNAGRKVVVDETRDLIDEVKHFALILAETVGM